MKHIDLVELTARASKGLDSGMTNDQLRELVACLRYLKCVSESAKLISTTSRSASVKSGASLSGEPMHYIVPLHVVNNINNLIKD